MKIDRKELRNILAAIKPGLGKKEFVNQTCHFMFFPDKIATFNERICIMHPFKKEKKPCRENNNSK